MSTPEILLVEDDPGDAELTRQGFRAAGVPVNLMVMQDGEAGLSYLRREDTKRPQLILLDLNMPKMDGREMLSILKVDPELRSIPVVVLTTSDAPSDVEAVYDLHANACMRKPVDFGEFKKLVNDLRAYWFTHVVLPS